MSETGISAAIEALKSALEADDSVAGMKAELDLLRGFLVNVARIADTVSTK